MQFRGLRVTFDLELDEGPEVCVLHLCIWHHCEDPKEGGCLHERGLLDCSALADDLLDLGDERLSRSSLNEHPGVWHGLRPAYADRAEDQDDVLHVGIVQISLDVDATLQQQRVEWYSRQFSCRVQLVCQRLHVYLLRVKDFRLYSEQFVDELGDLLLVCSFWVETDRPFQPSGELLERLAGEVLGTHFLLGYSRPQVR